MGGHGVSTSNGAAGTGVVSPSGADVGGTGTGLGMQGSGEGQATARPQSLRSFAASGPYSQASQKFTKMAQRNAEDFLGHHGDDAEVEDVRKILISIRRQYDVAHDEAEKKEAQLKTLREKIRIADNAHGHRTDESHRLEDVLAQLEQQQDETQALIDETQTNRKVYEHVLARLQKEQAILKQKMLKMEDYVARKMSEVTQKTKQSALSNAERVSRMQELEALERDAEAEREVCSEAREVMEGEVKNRVKSNRRRAQFDAWRHEVRLAAANEAFNTSAGRLRKLYAIEKLQGNCLQKISFEQVELSQTTENGFQKIRDVTGLTDVMDIVHKFLNREVEHEQLKTSVKEAEVRLEALRQDLDAFRRDTESITFDLGSKRSDVGELFKEAEAHEQMLHDAVKEHETCSLRLQKTTLQVEHVRRWTERVSKALGSFATQPLQFDQPSQLPDLFERLHAAVEKYVAHIGQQVQAGKVHRKLLSQAQTREVHEQAKLLDNKQFLTMNCRVPIVADVRPQSRQNQSTEEDSAVQYAAERERYKAESAEVIRKAQADHQKKRSRV